jgi:hypothetical protein
LIERPDRVVIWKSQLERNDFPPVCAMTGAPAEVWRKFNFASTPGWAFLGGALMAAAMARRASGHLPLTRASVQKLRLVTWGCFGLLPLTIVLWIAAALVAPSSTDAVRSGVTGVLVLLGLVSCFGFLIGILIARKMIGPTAIVKEQPPGYYDALIELRHVHPIFVAEVRRLQDARAAQMAAAYQAPYPSGTWK